MRRDALIITYAQAEQTVAFLTALDDPELSLDVSRQKLCSFFPATFGRPLNEDQASQVLYFFRDYHILSWVKTTSTMKWFRTAAIVDALVGIAPMTNVSDEWKSKSRAAVQDLLG